MEIKENKTFTYTYEKIKTYSVTVTFKVVNGSWNDDTKADKTVTLTGNIGTSLYLSAGDIPDVGNKPDTGYKKKGSWDKTPDTTTAITSDTTYTFTYVAKDKITVKVTGTLDSKTYNGEEQSVKGYKVEIPAGADFTEADIKFSGSDEAKGKDVGTYEMGLKASDFTVDSEEYTVTFEVEDGSLEITPAEVLIVADDKEVVYGEDLPELTATVTGLIGSDTIDYSLRIADPDDRLKNAGTYTIEVILGGQDEQTELNLNAEATQGNYNVTTKDGTLTIDKHKLIIKTDSASKKYDGKALTEPGYSVDGLQYDEKIKVTTTGSQTKVGSSDNTYTIDWQETDKNNYEVEDELGTLKVTKASSSQPEDDDDEEEEDEEEEEEEKKSSPIKTGDENVLEGWIALMLLAGAGIVVVYRKRREF